MLSLETERQGRTNMKNFEDILKEAQADNNVLVFILLGSRGKRFENELSDYDVLMVVKDEVAKEYIAKYDVPLKNMDMPVQGLSEFRNYVKWGGPETTWERYDFTHHIILIDRAGEIAKIAQEIGIIPSEIQHDFIYKSLDAYVNAAFRSVKAWKNKNPIGAQLEAASSIPYFLDALFGVYGRPKPYYGYLEKELEKYPLEGMSWQSNELVQTLLPILKTADLGVQQKLLKESEQFFRQKGFGKMFDAWEGKDKWAMEWKEEN